MIRRLWPLLAAALAFATIAQAQVAAPELVPAAPRHFAPSLLSFNGATVTPDNPAALQWSAPSAAAFGLFNHTSETPPAAPNDFSGWFVGYRGISDRFSFGLEHTAASADTGTFDESATSAQVSMQVLEGLAIGAGLDRSEWDNGTTNRQEEENTFGFSVNLAKQFYLGYAIGRDKYEDNTASTGSRDTTLYGIAFRTEGSWRWHLAYDVLDKDHYTNITSLGFDATTITVQVGVGNWVFGAQAVAFAYKGSPNDLSTTVIDVGWVPEKAGLSLTARLWDGSTSGGAPSDESGAALNLAYRY
jgi:hypothetical protein